MLKTIALIGLFGAFGAVVRSQVCILLPPVEGFPLGTLAVNAAGSLMLGFLTGASMSSDTIPESWRAPVATGFLGSLTTFSTFSVETVQLLEKEASKTALLYAGAQLALGLTLAWLGLLLGRSLFRGY